MYVILSEVKNPGISSLPLLVLAECEDRSNKEGAR